MKPAENELIRKILAEVAAPSNGQASPTVRSGWGRRGAVCAPARLRNDSYLRLVPRRNAFSARQHPADSVGWKCLARAVSDIAAMGGEPRCFLAEPRASSEADRPVADGFSARLAAGLAHWGAPLAGGDTPGSEILINITVVGEVGAGGVLRSEHDRATLSMSVGGSARRTGLQLLRATPGSSRPMTRCIAQASLSRATLALGQWLAEHGWPPQ